MANNPEVTDVSSSPPQVSDRMRELVDTAMSRWFDVGDYDGSLDGYKTVRSYADEAKAVLLREIAALEAERDHYARQTDELFKQTPEYAEAMQEMRAVLHKYGFRVEDSDVK